MPLLSSERCVCRARSLAGVSPFWRVFVPDIDPSKRSGEIFVMAHETKECHSTGAGSALVSVPCAEAWSTRGI